MYKNVIKRLIDFILSSIAIIVTANPDKGAVMYRLVWHRWILSVSLSVSIEYTCGSGMQLKWEILQDV